MAQPAATQFVDLPQQVLLAIYARLESIDALRLGCTCRHLASQLLDEQLWRQACEERWCHVAPFAAHGQWQWKDVFFRRNGWATDVQMQVSVVQHMQQLGAVAMSHDEQGVF